MSNFSIFGQKSEKFDEKQMVLESPTFMPYLVIWGLKDAKKWISRSDFWYLG